MLNTPPKPKTKECNDTEVPDTLKIEFTPIIGGGDFNLEDVASAIEIQELMR